MIGSARWVAHPRRTRRHFDVYVRIVLLTFVLQFTSWTALGHKPTTIVPRLPPQGRRRPLNPARQGRVPFGENFIRSRCSFRAHCHQMT
jgi:hypothetical protein